MRRIAAFALCLILLCVLSGNARAASSASSVSLSATVSSDGSCQVTVDVSLVLDSAVSELYFPLPRQARNITVNGSSARVTRLGNASNVNITGLVKGVTGNVTLRLQYTLNNLVDYVQLEETSKLQLQLPLLSGFSLPVDKMDFTVNLPAAVDAKPIFTSGYFQQSIEEDIHALVNGATITGSLGAPDLFIGHDAAAKTFDTTYRAIRFYDRALTAEEVAANAAVDGFGADAE